jgi:hypothetical protein
MKQGLSQKKKLIVTELIETSSASTVPEISFLTCFSTKGVKRLKKNTRLTTSKTTRSSQHLLPILPSITIHIITHLVAKLVRMRIRTEGGHIEHFTWIEVYTVKTSS